MLFEFITTHRDELIVRARLKVSKRATPVPTERELVSGVPLFLEHLAEALQDPPASVPGTLERAAARHGAALLALGYSVAQVVHDYGDICQAVTELADETNATITTDEFHTLNRCLDVAIAEAVTEHTRIRERQMTDGEAERSGVFAHELRNCLSAVHLGFGAIQTGRAPIGGSVAALVTRNLHAMTTLINRALVEVRLDAGHTHRQRVPLHLLLDDAEIEGTMEAALHGVTLRMTPLDHGIDIDVDPQIFAGALANLMQNAFKFTRKGGRVAVTTSVMGGRVEIAISDECGGLPLGKAAELFGAFKQLGTDRSGLGLGLFISRKGIEASGGLIRVRDVAGHGCDFTIDLPVLPGAAA
jgi:signal transduction histidine kinase